MNGKFNNYPPCGMTLDHTGEYFIVKLVPIVIISPATITRKAIF